MGECRSCGAAVTGGRFCANCGAPVAAEPTFLLEPDVGREPAAPSRSATPSNWRTIGGIGAVFAAVAVVLAVAGGGGTPTPTPTPKPSTSTTTAADTAATTTAATEASTTTELAISTTTEPPWPEVVAVPGGLTGILDIGFIDRTLATLDLATGRLRPWAKIDTLPERLIPFERFVLIQGNGGPSAQRVDRASGVTTQIDGQVWIARAGSAGAVLQVFPTQSEFRLFRPDGAEIKLRLPPLHYVSGLAKGRVVVQVADEIALLDPAEGSLTPFASGQLVAANDRAIARFVCTVGRCELHAGPWDDPDRFVVGDVPPEVWPIVELSPDGSKLLWRPSNGDSTARLDVLELASGARHSLEVAWGNGAAEVAVTPDGRFVVEDRGRDLRLHPLDGTAPLVLGPLPVQVASLAFRPA